MAPTEGKAGPWARCCRALSTIPLYLLGALLLWAWYAGFLNLGIAFLLVRQRAYGLFAFHALVFNCCWWMTVWSLIVTTTRGPGFVEKGTRREQDVGLLRPPPSTTGKLRGRRKSSMDRDSGVGSDIDPVEAGGGERAPFLGGASEASDEIPLDRLVQQASILAGFDAKEAHPGHVHLAGDGLLTAKADGSVRYCRKCQTVKPDRAHHCSICNQCVLMMDHHCPWVSTCVGHRNRKAFTLFLIYANLFSIYCCISAGLALLTFVENAGTVEYTPISWAFLMLLGGIFGLVLSGFTGYHIFLVARNRTTLENMESTNRLRFAPEPERPNARYRSDWGLSRDERRKLNKAASRLNLFDLGWRRNLEQVFGPPTLNGTSPYGWASYIIPGGPIRGDGRTWIVNEANRAKLEAISRQIRLDEEEVEAEDDDDDSEEGDTTTSGSGISPRHDGFEEETLH